MRKMTYKTRIMRIRELPDRLDTVTNQVGDVYNPTSFVEQTTREYLAKLDLLSKMPASRSLTQATKLGDQALVKSIKLDQPQRRWYFDSDATAILLDFDHQTLDQVQDALSLVNCYKIISTTSTDGVHVVIPTLEAFPLRLQPSAAVGFMQLYGLLDTLDHDRSATGGLNRGFYDPTRVLQRVKYIIQEGPLFDFRKIPAAILPIKLKSIDIDTAPTEDAIADDRDELAAQSDPDVIATPDPLKKILREAIKHNWDSYASSVVAQVEDWGGTNIKVKPANELLAGAVAKYVVDGHNYVAVCYSSGIIIGMSSDKKDTQVFVGYAQTDTRVGIASYIAATLQSCQIRHCGERWYWLYDKWILSTSLASKLAMYLNQCFNYTLDVGTDVKSAWRSRIRDTSRILQTALDRKTANHVIESKLPDIISVDMQKIWEQFGDPTTLTTNVHVIRYRNEQPNFDFLGLPVNGYKLTRRNWRMFARVSIPDWLAEFEPRYIAQHGFIYGGWTQMHLYRKLARLPAVIVIEPPVESEYRKSHSEYLVAVACCRQMIHAASSRGTQVIVLTPTRESDSIYGMLHLNKRACRSSLEIIKKFSVTLPTIK